MQDAATNMSVSNVTASTKLHPVIFVPTTTPKINPVLPGHQSLPTPKNRNRLETFLDGYTPSIASYLIKGFAEGFRLEFEGEMVSLRANNLLSAFNNPEVVTSKLHKELEADRLAGPFTTPPFEIFRVSPLGVVPKKVPGEFRMIHHLSFPKGSSVNDGILPENSSVHYSTIQEAIRYVTSVGRNCYLAKTDIKNAFRIIPVHPDKYPILGICWDDLYYYDKCMPMGCSSSCKIFETFSTAIEWVARHKCSILTFYIY